MKSKVRDIQDRFNSGNDSALKIREVFVKEKWDLSSRKLIQKKDLFFSQKFQGFFSFSGEQKPVSNLNDLQNSLFVHETSLFHTYVYD